MGECYIFGSGGQGLNLNIAYSELSTNIAEWPYLNNEDSDGVVLSTTDSAKESGYDLTYTGSSTGKKVETFPIDLIPENIIILRANKYKNQELFTGFNDAFGFSITIYHTVGETTSTTIIQAPQNSTWSLPQKVPTGLIKAEVTIEWKKDSNGTTDNLFIQPQVCYIKLKEEEMFTDIDSWKQFIKDNPLKFPEYEPYSRRTKHPSLNTIWIDGPEVPEWSFETTNPYTSDGGISVPQNTYDTVKHGTVWFQEGIASPAPMNLSKNKNTLMVYPTACYQYNSTTTTKKWEQKFPSSFIIPQGESEAKWVEWKPFLYTPGTQTSTWKITTNGGWKFYTSRYCFYYEGYAFPYGANGGNPAAGSCRAIIPVVIDNSKFKTLKIYYKYIMGAPNYAGTPQGIKLLSSMDESASTPLTLSLETTDELASGIYGQYNEFKQNTLQDAKTGTNFVEATLDLTTLSTGKYYLSFYGAINASDYDGGGSGGYSFFACNKITLE